MKGGGKKKEGGRGREEERGREEGQREREEEGEREGERERERWREEEREERGEGGSVMTVTLDMCSSSTFSFSSHPPSILLLYNPFLSSLPTPHPQPLPLVLLQALALWLLEPASGETAAKPGNNNINMHTLIGKTKNTQPI